MNTQEGKKTSVYNNNNNDLTKYIITQKHIKHYGYILQQTTYYVDYDKSILVKNENTNKIAQKQNDLAHGDVSQLKYKNKNNRHQLTLLF